MISKNGRSPVEPAAIASLNQLSDLIKRNQKKRSLLQGGYTESWKSSQINDFAQQNEHPLLSEIEPVDDED